MSAKYRIRYESYSEPDAYIKVVPSRVWRVYAPDGKVISTHWKLATALANLRQRLAWQGKQQGLTHG